MVGAVIATTLKALFDEARPIGNPVQPDPRDPTRLVSYSGPPLTVGGELYKPAMNFSHSRNWPARIVSAKHHAVEACWRIVDRAMEVSGGAGMFKGQELEQLFRDARCGRFHPTNTFLVHEIVAKTALGIDLGEQWARSPGVVPAGAP